MPPALTPDSQFIVKEEKWLNYIMAILFSALFLYGLIDAILRQFRHIDYQSIIFSLALIPAWLFFRKAQSKRVYIRVNRKGIYQDERLVTGWKGLLKASIGQKEKTITIKDNFMLMLEFVKDDPKKGYRKMIPLTNTQNQAEEDVLAAVHYFWKLYRQQPQP